MYFSFGIFVQLILLPHPSPDTNFQGANLKQCHSDIISPFFFFIKPQLFISILRCVTDLNVFGTGQQAERLDNRDAAVATESLEGILTHSYGCCLRCPFRPDPHIRGYLFFFFPQT